MQQSSVLEYAQTNALQKASMRDSQRESVISNDAVVNSDMNNQAADTVESQKIINSQLVGATQNNDFKILVLKEAGVLQSDQDVKDGD